MDETATCFEYARQQVYLSELTSEVLKENDVLDAVFPMVGADILTASKLNTIVWNAEGLRAGKSPRQLAYGARVFRESYEEGVVFNVCTLTGWKTIMWKGPMLIRIPSTSPIEIQWSREHVINMTNDHRSSLWDSNPIIYTKFVPGTAYYVYIDGGVFFLASTPCAFLEIKNGVMYAKNDLVVTNTHAEDGRALIDLTDMSVIKYTFMRPDSQQQLQVCNTKMVTTTSLIRNCPYLEGPHVENLGDHRVEVVVELDTRKTTYQIIEEKDVAELDNRKKVLLSQSSLLFYDRMVTSGATVAVVAGNMRFFPLNGMVRGDIGVCKGQRCVRYRTGGPIHLIRNKKPYHVNGTWYQLIDTPSSSLSSSYGDDVVIKKDFDIRQSFKGILNEPLFSDWPNERVFDPDKSGYFTVNGVTWKSVIKEEWPPGDIRDPK